MSKVMSLGSLRGRAFPAGVGEAGMGPRPWATYPGSGGPNQVLDEPYGSGPQWRTNYITNPVVSPQEPQNLQRVFNGGVPLEQPPVGASSGQPIRGAVLGALGLGQVVNPATNRTSFTMGTGALSPAQACEVHRARSFLLSATGTAVGVYHGYNRNRSSVGWGLAWGLLGWFFPVVITGVSLFQGPGKAK